MNPPFFDGLCIHASPFIGRVYIYIYVVGTFRVYFVPLGNAIIIEKNQQKSHLMDLSFHWLLVKRDQLVSRPYSDQE